MLLFVLTVSLSCRLENYRGAKTDESKQDNLLPVSHTCMFSLELPRYSNLDAMTEKVTVAMVHCAVIDGDGMGRCVVCL